MSLSFIVVFIVGGPKNKNSWLRVHKIALFKSRFDSSRQRSTSIENSRLEQFSNDVIILPVKLKIYGPRCHWFANSKLSEGLDSEQLTGPAKNANAIKLIKGKYNWCRQSEPKLLHHSFGWCNTTKLICVELSPRHGIDTLRAKTFALGDSRLQVQKLSRQRSRRDHQRIILCYINAFFCYLS